MFDNNKLIKKCVSLAQRINYNSKFDEYANNKLLEPRLVKACYDELEAIKNRNGYGGRSYDLRSSLDKLYDKYGSNLRLKYNTYSGSYKRQYLDCCFYEFGYQLNLYFMLLDDAKYMFVKEVVLKYQLHKINNQADYIQLAKRVSTLYKRMGGGISPYWIYVVDIHVLSGVVTQPIEKFDAKIQDWVLGDEGIQPNIDGDHDAYVSMMLQSGGEIVDAVFANYGGSPLEFPTMRELISQPERWTTTGSSTSFKTAGTPVLDVSRKWLSDHGIQNTKGAISIFGNVNKIMHALTFSEIGFNAYGAQKDELGKPREIVTGDDISYFIMRFLFQPFMDYSTKSKFNWCYAYMSNEDKHKLDIEVINWLCEHNVPPADADMFDKHQSKKLILGMCEMIARKTADYMESKGQDVLEYNFFIDRMLALWPNSKVFVTQTGSEYSWNGGVLSGWFITIMIDSIISASYCRLGLKILNSWRGEYIGEHAISLGDDLLPLIGNEERVVQFLIIMIDVLHIKFNPGKFWTEGKRSEFLRKVYFSIEPKKGFGMGYAVRGIPKMVFQKDNTSQFMIDQSGAETGVVNEIMAKYDRMNARGCDYERCISIMEFECSKFIKDFNPMVVKSMVASRGYTWIFEHGKSPKFTDYVVSVGIRNEPNEIFKPTNNSPASSEIKVANSMGVDVTNELLSSLKINNRLNKVRVKQYIKEVEYDLLEYGEDNYNASYSLEVMWKQWLFETTPIKEDVDSYGPNIAAKLLVKRRREKPTSYWIHSALANYLDNEGIALVEFVAQKGISWFGGPETYSLMHSHARLVGHVLALLTRRMHVEGERNMITTKHLRTIIARVMFDNTTSLTSSNYLMYK